MKRCTRCQQEKELSAFAPQRNICRACRYEKQNAFYSKPSTYRRVSHVRRPVIRPDETAVQAWIHAFVMNDTQCQNYLMAKGA